MFKNKKCLVTGGTGMIGRQVVDLLVKKGADVTSVSLDELFLNKSVGYLVGDLRDFELCLDITEGMDYVFHIAGMKGNKKITILKPATFFTRLLQINTNVLEACRINEVIKVVYTSTIGAYSSKYPLKEVFWWDDKPMDDAPGWAKRMGEYQIDYIEMEDGLDWVCARLGNTYGIGDNFNEDAMVIPSLIRKIKKNPADVEVWSDGTRDFCYSKDIAKGLIQLAGYEGLHNFFNLGGRSHSVSTILSTLHRFIEFDYHFLNTGISERVIDSSLARNEFRFNPTTSLEEGLRETWDWYLTNKEHGRYDYFK